MGETRLRPERGSGLQGAPVERNPGAAARIPHDPRAEGWRLRLTAWEWNGAWELVRALPEGAALALADLLARLAARWPSAARERLRRNLKRVVDSQLLEATVKAAYRSYARYWIEAFRVSDLDPLELERRTEVVGLHNIDAALDRERGVIVLLAHHGSWELAARWAESHGYHMAAVAEVVRPRALFEKFVRLREAIGLEIVPLATREPGAARSDHARQRRAQRTERLVDVLRENHLVGLLSDRDLTGRGPVTELFGEPCALPAGAAVLAQRTGAVILPITMLQCEGRRYRLVILPEVVVDGMAVRDALRRVAEGLEELIRLDPAQWHAFQPIWLADQRRAGRGSEG